MSTQPKTAITSREFRNVMGLFATGVTVLAVEIEGEIYGMTANAITSVSLEPLLILVCVQKEAHMATYLQQARQFSVNILAENREDLSNYFAGIWSDSEPPDFTFEAWNCGPRLVGALGALACRVEQFIEGGDHWIVIAAVVDLFQAQTPANPLLYYRGRYRRLLDNSKS
jgi:flavin reductase (DIM6/NTAB) family NADH-FMN oxidoreductase RutF